jgi:hypothetical protein
MCESMRGRKWAVFILLLSLPRALLSNKRKENENERRKKGTPPPEF